MENKLRTQGVTIAQTEGDSMEPMLKNGDTVIIASPIFPLKKYDVPVYHRLDHLTMHRIVKVKKQGYIICGDNRVKLEHDITDNDIIGILSGFYKNGAYIDVNDSIYIEYCRRICRTYPIRYISYIWTKIKKKLIKGGHPDEGK